MEVLEKAEKHVVVTHAQLLNISEKILEKYEIIIDEDILRTSLRSIGTIDTSDIQQLLNTGNIGGSRSYDFQKLLMIRAMDTIDVILMIIKAINLKMI